MIKTWKQIDLQELSKIEILISEWYSIPNIAKLLWRSKNTIYELLKNNWVWYWIKRSSNWKNWSLKWRWKWKKKIYFDSLIVLNKRKTRKSLASKRYSRIEPDWKLESYILEKIINNQWSPEQISGRRKLETRERLSKDTIYRYIYSNHFSLVKKFFRRKWKKYQHWKENKYRLQDRRMIDLRPEIVDSRSRIWDWEWDTIVWLRWWSKQVILTNVERKSWYLLAKKLYGSTWENVLNWTIKLFESIPKYKIKTMTYDNWREFSEHRMIEYYTNLTVYFAHPYHSWERWTNENTNWLLRQYVPKKTDFKTISEKELQNYVKRINLRPRKRLWYLNPFEVFHSKSPNSV